MSPFASNLSAELWSRKGTALATSVIHFGVDDCSRVLVLQEAGYRVHQCDFVPELRLLLLETSRPAAALFGESSRIATIEAVSLLRELAVPPPIVFFSSAFDTGDERPRPDLAVPVFTSPERWLRWIACFVDQSRTLRAESISIRERAASLRCEAMTAGRKNAFERMQCAQTIAEMEDRADEVIVQPLRSLLPN